MRKCKTKGCTNALVGAYVYCNSCYLRWRDKPSKAQQER